VAYSGHDILQSTQATSTPRWHYTDTTSTWRSFQTAKVFVSISCDAHFLPMYDSIE